VTLLQTVAKWRCIKLRAIFFFWTTLYSVVRTGKNTDTTYQSESSLRLGNVYNSHCLLRVDDTRRHSGTAAQDPPGAMQLVSRRCTHTRQADSCSLACCNVRAGSQAKDYSRTQLSCICRTPSRLHSNFADFSALEKYL